jgi:hypothetical protein
MIGDPVMRARGLKNLFVGGLVFLIVLILSVAFQLELPAPTGPHAVSQTIFRWVDTSRPEALTKNPDDFREVIALIWYPAERGTGTKCPYFPGLSNVSKSLIESGEVTAWEVFGLQFIRSQNLMNASLAKSNLSYPVLIFSPGNGTNVEFYNSLASEIASHGYVVVGLNHPYDVAAVELSDHTIAPFYKEQDALGRSANQKFIAQRIRVRTLDVLFTLHQLDDLNINASSPFSGMLDLNSVAVAGHSLGGITASESCKADTRFRACLNLDGIQRGGPFSTEETAIPPEQPFLFLTKESQLPPKLIEKFKSTMQSYWVAVHGAAHDSFTDGPLLQPSMVPVTNRADRIMSVIEKYTLAFLDQTLKGNSSRLLARSVQLQDVTVQVYPSN